MTSALTSYVKGTIQAKLAKIDIYIYAYLFGLVCNSLAMTPSIYDPVRAVKRVSVVFFWVKISSTLYHGEMVGLLTFYRQQST